MYVLMKKNTKFLIYLSSIIIIVNDFIKIFFYLINFSFGIYNNL